MNLNMKIPGMGWELNVKSNITVDSASSVSFIKQNVLHEFQPRYLNLKNYPLEKRISDLYCGVSDDTINILGKNIRFWVTQQISWGILYCFTSRHSFSRFSFPSMLRSCPPLMKNGVLQKSTCGTSFFVKRGHERNILENENLLKLGIEVKQYKIPQPIC